MGDEFLQRQFERLGEMMGDGEHLEPGGGWISREYKRIGVALGHIPARDVQGINAAMARALETAECHHCGGALEQTRSGSRRARCPACEVKYQFKPAKKKGRWAE